MLQLQTESSSQICKYYIHPYHWCHTWSEKIQGTAAPCSWRKMILNWRSWWLGCHKGQGDNNLGVKMKVLWKWKFVLNQCATAYTQIDNLTFKTEVIMSKQYSAGALSSLAGSLERYLYFVHTHIVNREQWTSKGTMMLILNFILSFVIFL